VLAWLAVAFCGIFTRAKAGANVEDIFYASEILAGAKEFFHSNSDTMPTVAGFAYTWETFAKELVDAETAAEREFKIARIAVQCAGERGWNRKINVPSLGREITMVLVQSDSVKVGPAGRAAGHQIVIQRTKNGNIQIHGGTLHVKEGKVIVQRLQLDLTPLVVAIRRAEQRFSNCTPNSLSQLTDDQLAATGMANNWYFAEYRTSVYNGTLSAQDVPPTLIRARKLFDIVAENLPRCSAIAQEERNGTKHPVPA
jgi:hypothetical protein